MFHLSNKTLFLLSFSLIFPIVPFMTTKYHGETAALPYEFGFMLGVIFAALYSVWDDLDHEAGIEWTDDVEELVVGQTYYVISVSVEEGGKRYFMLDSIGSNGRAGRKIFQLPAECGSQGLIGRSAVWLGDRLKYMKKPQPVPARAGVVLRV